MPVSLIDRRSTLAYVPEPLDNTINRANPWDITPTGAGLLQAALTSAQLNGATNDLYVGGIIEVVDRDSNVYGECVRVLAFNAATDTLTLESFSAVPNSITSQVRMWTPPQAIVSPTGVGSSTTVVDTKRTEATSDYWADPDRYWMVGHTGSNAGKWASITGWNAGTDTFTVASGPGSAAWGASTVGDFNEILRPVFPVGGELPRGETPQMYIDRRFVQNVMTLQPGVMGPRDNGTLAVALEVKGPAAISSGATTATRPLEAGDLLKSILGEDADGSGTVGGGATTTSIPLGVGEGARFAVGNLVLINGELAGITAISTDTLTISPALSNAPASGVICYGGVNYTPINTGYRSTTWLAWIGGTMRQVMFGHLPNLKIEGLTKDEIPRFMFEGPLDGYIQYPTSAGINWTPQFDTTIPIPARVARIVLGGANVHNVTATFDVGYEVAPRTAVTGFAGRDGNEIIGRKSTGTLKTWLDEGSSAMDQLRRLQRGAIMELLIQCGSDKGEVFGLWIPRIQYTAAPITLEGGQATHDIAFNVIDATATAATLKDFTIGLV